MADGQTLVLGMIGAGKSTLMKRTIIPSWKAQGVPVIVCDPLGTRWPGADWVTKDAREFTAAMRGSRRIVGIVDEFWESIGKDWQTVQDCAYLATMARNDGHRVYFMGQRAVHVPPTYRCQCREVFAFCQTPKDAKELVGEYGDPALENCVNLPDGEVIHWRRGLGAYKTAIQLG